MEMNLVVPVASNSPRQVGDEEINGKLWRVVGPYPSQDITDLRFHCVSYVWGAGVEAKGGFFDCKRDISDQTRPALEAVIKAAEGIKDESTGTTIEAFWIDALCIPPAEGPARYKTLESMGFIYNAAQSVIIVLKSPAWSIVQQAASTKSPDAMSDDELSVLEADSWVSRVWTYQELVNSQDTYFTSAATSSTLPNNKGHALINSEQFLNCIGFSLSRWKTRNEKSERDVLVDFPNLNTLMDALLDCQMSGYLVHPALSILCNMSLRAFDAQYPQNRLLACVGVLTKEAEWGSPLELLEALSEKVMLICEGKNDLSFIYTADKRSAVSGSRWRPDPMQGVSTEAVNLIPIIAWHCVGNPLGETQRGHVDASGFWLDGLVHLNPAENVNADAELALKRFSRRFAEIENPALVGGSVSQHGVHDLEIRNWIDYLLHFLVRIGFRSSPQPLVGRNISRHESQDPERGNWIDDLLRFLVQIGFRGSPQPLVCESGLFFAQENLDAAKDVELFATSSLKYAAFGSPGLARWQKGEDVMYCAGVFVGILDDGNTQSILVGPGHTV